MDEKLLACETLDEIVDLGMAVILQKEQEERQRANEAQEEERNKQIAFLQAADELLPKVLQPCHYFEDWHNPVSTATNWDAITMLEVPGCAPVRIRWDRFWTGKERAVRIWEGGRNSQFKAINVISFRVMDIEGELVIVEQYFTETDDLAEALAVAAKLGDTRSYAEQELRAQEVQRELAPPIAAKPIPEPTLAEKLAGLLREIIQEIEINEAL